MQCLNTGPLFRKIRVLLGFRYKYKILAIERKYDWFVYYDIWLNLAGATLNSPYVRMKDDTYKVLWELQRQIFWIVHRRLIDGIRAVESGIENECRPIV